MRLVLIVVLFILLHAAAEHMITKAVIDMGGQPIKPDYSVFLKLLDNPK